MKTLLSALAVAALLGGSAGSALAQNNGNNANPNAPGQDRTCLVTTGKADSFNDADVVSTKWLPRKAADAQASKDPHTMKTFDYASDPLVTNGTYKSAQDLCENHFK
jgi:hypothetical protein